MPLPVWAFIVGVFLAALGLPADTLAQSSAPGGCLLRTNSPPPITDANRKPAPPRSLTGTWIPFGRFGVATQAGGVSSKPNNGRPENQLPYTPFGLELYRSHMALEGADAVRPAEGNDPRNLCEPLGMPRFESLQRQHHPVLSGRVQGCDPVSVRQPLARHLD